MKNKENNFGNNMMLITGYWQNADTFKLIPVSEDCPYSEIIYDPNTTLLVVLSKIAKTNFQMIPRLDENGNKIRSTKKKENGVEFKEQRTTIDVFTEFYIVDKEEQIEFVKMFAVNAATYDYKKYMKDSEAAEMGEGLGKELTLPDTKLVDATGQPLTSNK